MSSGVTAWVLVHLKRMRSLQLAFRAVRTVSSSSKTVAMSVEMVIGLAVAAACRISIRSVFSKDATGPLFTAAIEDKSIPLPRGVGFTA